MINFRIKSRFFGSVLCFRLVCALFVLVGVICFLVFDGSSSMIRSYKSNFLGTLKCRCKIDRNGMKEKEREREREREKTEQKGRRNIQRRRADGATSQRQNIFRVKSSLS